MYFQIEQLKQIGTMINQMVDFDASIREQRMCVKPNNDDQLDALQRTYAGLDDFLVCIDFIFCND